MTLQRAYEPAALEQPTYQFWEHSRLFAATPDDPHKGDPFVIVIPPPNVTGVLHIGHALVMSLQDVFIRHARMQGRNAVWLPGTDHAGIATQVRVEQELATEGKTRHDLGREAFVARVVQWQQESGGSILQQLRLLGCSCDWDREAFTLDEPRSRAVRKVFADMYNRGLIYRGVRLINWDPVSESAISDIEVEHKMVQGQLTYFKYVADPAQDAGQSAAQGARHPEAVDELVVATTRPETLLGDTAVAVHPDDPRYQHLIGTNVLVPFLGRSIPVVADAHVDPAFGTGAVKVTPAHDPNDWEIGQRHNLPAIDVMTNDGKINAEGGPYAGLDRFEARKRIQADLERDGLLVTIEAHEHQVGHSDRTKVPVEPRLSEQWFIDVSELRQDALRVVEDETIRFIPERGKKQMVDWLSNLHDWTISRQLWWGHQIPAWYDEDGGVHVFEHDPTPEQWAELKLVRQDEDVLDTWFSSALWPFTTLGWPDETPEMAAWYPTTSLITGYDINAFWVSRMIMMSQVNLGTIPFSTVINNGLVRDEFGKKMSKSVGNVINPTELIEEHGADALRYALFRSATPGSDVPLAVEWVEGARRFANKLWNAAKLTGMRTEGMTPERALAIVNEAISANTWAHLEDHWMLSRLQATMARVDEGYAAYDLSIVTQSLYHFIWDEFADWYLELAKLRDDEVCQAILVTVLEHTMRILHPIMPFVTEHIWRDLHGLPEIDADTAPLQGYGPGEREACSSLDNAQAINTTAWPSAPVMADATANAQAEQAFGWVQQAVTELRRVRATYQCKPSQHITVAVVVGADMQRIVDLAQDGICRLAKIENWTQVDAKPAGPHGAMTVGGVDFFVDLDGLVDLEVERERIGREIEHAQTECARAQAKLENPRFVDKAPAQVVQVERDKITAWSATIATLETQLKDYA